MKSLNTKGTCLFLVVYALSFQTSSLKGLDVISKEQSLSGHRTISSKDETFELGFFTPGKSQNYYIGIWYKKFPSESVVWVANRNHPISDPYGAVLKLLPFGNLVLLNESRHEVWSTNSSSKAAISTVAMLLDNGNFVIKSDSSDVIIWQSFDFPTDTWLCRGGKIGYNKIRNEKVYLTSWKSSENPAPGVFSFEVDATGKAITLVYNRTDLYWSTGAWTGSNFADVPEADNSYYIRNLTYISNENESVFTYDTTEPDVLTRFLIDAKTGQLKELTWRDNFVQSEWIPNWMRPLQQCDVYGFCGAFGICNSLNAPSCICMQGFEPKEPKNWEVKDYKDGCIRKIPLKCGNDTFFSMPNSLLPENFESLNFDSAKDCELACLSNCSCNAYTFDVGKCLVWIGELYNLQQLTTDYKTGRTCLVRIAYSGNKAKPFRVWIIIGAIGGSLIFACFIVVVVIRRRKQKNVSYSGTDGDALMVFKYKDLRNATKNFSEKLGEGGFGSVYKGTFCNSKIVAVKSLNNVHQGEKQFRAEVNTIGLIQHINLVRLHGFCIEGKKRFLVYDYMKNGSLESFLFQNDSSVLLDWKTRYNIMLGIARGLVYCHEKCRNCIIHCDIKPENILLDDEFNAKLADFGLAKLHGRDISRVLTTLRGTVGYLAPEWFSGEAITVKADVFSFGMLLFEIISGKRNRDFSDGKDDYFSSRNFSCDGEEDYFPGRVAREIFNEGEDKLILLLDKRLQGNADIAELARACKVACWCIQDDEKDRPTMEFVVQILEGVSEVGNPPIPRFLLLHGFLHNEIQTGFFERYTSCTTTSSISSQVFNMDL